MMVSAPGVKNIHRPAFAAGAPGRVAIVYYASSDPNAQMQSAYITQTADALDSAPLFYSGALNDPAQPIFHDYGLSSPMPRTDFIGGAYDAAGRSFWTGVVKQLAPPGSSSSSSGDFPTVGYVGRLAFAASTPRALRGR
jgi:hypothetical protein